MKTFLKGVGVSLLSLVVVFSSVIGVSAAVNDLIFPPTRIETNILYNVDPVGQPLFFFDVEEMDDFLLERRLIEGGEVFEFSAIHGFIEGGRNIRVETDSPIKINIQGLHYGLQKVQETMVVNGVLDTEVVFDKVEKIQVTALNGEAEITVSLGDKFSYRVDFVDFPQFFVDAINELDEIFPGIAEAALGSKSIKMIEMKSNVNGNIIFDRSLVEVDEENMGFTINDERAVVDGETVYLMYYEVLRS